MRLHWKIPSLEKQISQHVRVPLPGIGATPEDFYSALKVKNIVPQPRDIPPGWTAQVVLRDYFFDKIAVDTRRAGSAEAIAHHFGTPAPSLADYLYNSEITKTILFRHLDDGSIISVAVTQPRTRVDYERFIRWLKSDLQAIAQYSSGEIDAGTMGWQLSPEANNYEFGRENELVRDAFKKAGKVPPDDEEHPTIDDIVRRVGARAELEFPRRSGLRANPRLLDQYLTTHRYSRWDEPELGKGDTTGWMLYRYNFKLSRRGRWDIPHPPDHLLGLPRYGQLYAVRATGRGAIAVDVGLTAADFTEESMRNLLQDLPLIERYVQAGNSQRRREFATGFAARAVIPGLAALGWYVAEHAIPGAADKIVTDGLGTAAVLTLIFGVSIEEKISDTVYERVSPSLRRIYLPGHTPPSRPDFSPDIGLRLFGDEMDQLRSLRWNLARFNEAHK